MVKAMCSVSLLETSCVSGRLSTRGAKNGLSRVWAGVVLDLPAPGDGGWSRLRLGRRASGRACGDDLLDAGVESCSSIVRRVRRDRHRNRPDRRCGLRRALRVCCRGRCRICRSVRSWNRPARERRRRDFRNRESAPAELFIEGLDGVGRIAFAIGAGDQDGVAFGDERCGGYSPRAKPASDVALGLELFGDLARQAFGGAGLRCIEDGDLERGWRLNAWTGGDGGSGVESGKKAVEPRALLWRERGIVGNEGNLRSA